LDPAPFFITMLSSPFSYTEFKRLRSPGIDSKESALQPAYVAWRAGTSNSVVVPARQAGNRFLGSLKFYKFWLWLLVTALPYHCGGGVFKLLRNPGIDSRESIPPVYVACAGILEQSMGARNREGRRLSYRPARLHRLLEISSVESIPGLLKSLKIPPLAGRYNNTLPTRFPAPTDCSKIPALDSAPPPFPILSYPLHPLVFSYDPSPPYFIDCFQSPNSWTELGQMS
jgi:hypothetical protein